MSKQKLIALSDLLELLLGFLSLLHIFHKLSLTCKEKKLNHSNHYSQQFLV